MSYATSNRHPNWKGDNVGVKSLHRWVKARIEKPKLCPRCNLRVARDLANISNSYNSETYTRELENWRWLCRKCHMIEDGRMDLFLNYARNHSLRYKD